MKRRSLFLLVAFCFCAAMLCVAAENPLVGTWKLNEAKSNIAAGSPKSSTVTYTAEGDSYKCVIDGTDPSGNPSHNEWTGKLDGKDYPVTGDPGSDSRSVKEINPHHYNVTVSKDGKVLATGTIAVDKDGKGRTVTIHSKDAKGKKLTTTEVFDKQ